MTLLLLVLLLAAAVVALRFFAGAGVRRRTARLVDESIESPDFAGLDGENWLARWLARAGYRDPGAPSIFLGLTAGGLALGLLSVFLMRKLGIVASMAQALQLIPGGVGDVLGVVAGWGPYILLVNFVAAPALVVRAARRARLEAIEQDLAPALELLATLAEAGLSFDSAIVRIRESESGERPLSREFQIYQRDVLGGISRMEALRKMSRRVDLTSISIFISALIQSEQVGASLAGTLRTQADDLRDRRKLRALLLAQALPVKLVFPLMICFLPGIFFPTLGPVLSQLVDVLDSVIQRR
jgi:tight adherence protein C